MLYPIPWSVESDGKKNQLILLYGGDGSGKTTCFVEWANWFYANQQLSVSYVSQVIPGPLYKGIKAVPSWGVSEIIFMDSCERSFNNDRDRLVQELPGIKAGLLFISDHRFSQNLRNKADKILYIDDWAITVERDSKRIMPDRTVHDHEGMIYNEYNQRWAWL